MWYHKWSLGPSHLIYTHSPTTGPWERQIICQKLPAPSTKKKWIQCETWIGKMFQLFLISLLGLTQGGGDCRSRNYMIGNVSSFVEIFRHGYRNGRYFPTLWAIFPLLRIAYLGLAVVTSPMVGGGEPGLMDVWFFCGRIAHPWGSGSCKRLFTFSPRETKVNCF